MSDPLLGLSFAVAAMVSLGASWVLVTSLERVGARLGFSEAVLGLVAALAADAPEITSAATALVRHDQRIGAGVVMGSNAFNLAALLGLSALVAGEIAFHRRALELSGALALALALVCLALVAGVLPPVAALIVGVALFAPYVAILALRRERLARFGLPESWTRWLASAVSDEELDIASAIHPRRGHGRDVLVSGLAVAVVVGASVVMEHTASELGQHWDLAPILVGGLVLAVVTSLPNAVAAVYLALRGRGAATLSTALNSNALNVLGGLLIPTSILGVGAPTAQTTVLALCFVAMTIISLACAYAGGGLRRADGVVIAGSYLVCVGLLVAVA